MIGLLQGMAVFALVYFAALNAGYAVLTVLSMRRLRRYMARVSSLYADEIIGSTSGLPISLLVPAYNESAGIVAAVRSFLGLRYPDYEIVVVNDGSNDETLAVLDEAFRLVPAVRNPTSELPTALVRGVYRSKIHPMLWVIDKENGGKADALNAAINHARNPLVCALDADTLLEEDALVRVARPFLEDQRTVAAGGIVRVVNGSDVDGGVVTATHFPRPLAARLQVVEYFRAFLAGRVGWDALGANLIISGAFGVFRRGAVAEVGGYATDTVGEDMELVVRLHRHYRERRRPYRIVFVPDPVAWTEAPVRWRDLGRQRDRWQRGLAQTLTRHRRMFLNPHYGAPGVVAFPYFVVFELLGPIFETMGYVTFVLALASGNASGAFVVAFLALAIFLGSALSLAAIALEEASFRRYASRGDLFRMLLVGLIETLGYRQLNTWWRLRGLVSALRGTTTWGTMSRAGFAPGPPAGEPAADGAGNLRSA